jgi:hypothetical protein
MTRFMNRLLPGSVILIVLAGVGMRQATAAGVLQELITPGSSAYRILPGAQQSEFWIVDRDNGLILLRESPPGTWNTTSYPIGRVYDACGPDANGYIYSCCWPTQSGETLLVFDSGGSPPCVVESLYFGQGGIISGATLSPDETELYVIGTDWGGSSVDSDEHVDSGILWQIDLESPGYPVLQQGVLAALPQTIYYAESDIADDKLIVYCVELHSLMRPAACRTDFIALVQGLPRQSQLLTPFVPEYLYCNEVVDWSDEDPLVALCNSFIYSEPEHPEYMDGLWIINTETNSVVETISVPTNTLASSGVRHALLSEVHPGWVYVTPGPSAADQLIIMDHDTGAYINRIDLAGYCIPEFMYELPDGRLIVTAGLAERILIIDPEL